MNCALCIFISSCDKIEGPTRKTIAIDTTCHFASDNSFPFKKVLVEEYTGHLCGNCPNAGVYLDDTLQSKFGDSLIIITVHAAFFAIPCPGGACPGNQPTGAFKYDFTCTAGTDWYNFFGISNNPEGMVDRIDFPTHTQVKVKSDWDPDVSNELAKPATVRIKILNTYDVPIRKVKSCIESKFLTNANGNFNLQVVLTEDSVINWQEWYNHTPEYVPDYAHRHILRAALNTSFGVQIVTGAISGNTALTNGYDLVLDPSWNDAHCSIVAFVYNNDTKEVIQVEEATVR